MRRLRIQFRKMLPMVFAFLSKGGADEDPYARGGTLIGTLIFDGNLLGIVMLGGI